jgi:arylsulfatase A-like enzyme
MAVRGNYKLVTDAALSPTQFYDLAEDPYELDDRVAATSERRNRDELQSLLRQWAVRTG